MTKPPTFISRILFTIGCLVAVTVSNASDTFQATRLQHDGLPNALRLHSNVISGGTPNDDAGFAQLKQIGVKTVISVDSARPDLETAKKYGLRYVHLPQGYDGISSTNARALAKAVTELAGPIYIHCHQGKHRSPTAAAIACIGAGFIEIEQGPIILRAAGTSERYVGLFAAVNEAQVFKQDDLKSLDISFPEAKDVPPLASAMVSIETIFDNLRMASRSNWKVNAAHPDIDAAHEALILKEHFAEIMRTVPSDASFDGFRSILRNTHLVASRMEGELNRGRLTAETRSELSSTIRALQVDCRRCHASYRNARRFEL